MQAHLKPLLLLLLLLIAIGALLGWPQPLVVGWGEEGGRRKETRGRNCMLHVLQINMDHVTWGMLNKSHDHVHPLLFGHLLFSLLIHLLLLIVALAATNWKNFLKSKLPKFYLVSPFYFVVLVLTLSCLFYHLLICHALMYLYFSMHLLWQFTK